MKTTPTGPAAGCCRQIPWLRFAALFALIAAGGAPLPGAAPATTEEQLLQLAEENRQLRAILLEQRSELSELRRMVESLAAGHSRDSTAATEPANSFPPEPMAQADEPSPRRNGDRDIIVGGQAGVAFFAGGSDSQFPNNELRVDEAILTVEAQAARNAFFFSELYLTRREAYDDTFHLGELYVDLESVSSLWGHDGLLSLRLGRFDSPFGEEYLHRDPIANPLVTHSLADIWGTDEGIEVYGGAGRWDYVFAVQNGSQELLHDYNEDKALIARVGFNPAPRTRVSVSAMRTGDLDVVNEPLSEIWIGNNVFRSIGSDETTTHHAELAQIDARQGWSNGHILGAYGKAWYGDDDPLGDNSRDFTFYHIEAMQAFSRTFYGAARFSRIEAGKGYPLVGLGDFGKYFFSPLLTRELWRLGLGVGWHVSDNLLLKTEYTFEEGRLSNGARRGNSNQFSAEAALRF
ncbi:MAG: hypothetical protein ACREIA_00290 [Opitutaceae bacterium]